MKFLKPSEILARAIGALIVVLEHLLMTLTLKTHHQSSDQRCESNGCCRESNTCLQLSVRTKQRRDEAQ